MRQLRQQSSPDERGECEKREQRRLMETLVNFSIGHKSETLSQFDLLNVIVTIDCCLSG